MRFKRHTFVELTRRAPIPSVTNANADAAISAASQDAPQPMVHPTTTYHAPRVLSRAYAGSLRARGVPRFAAALVRWRHDWRARRRV